MTQPKNFDPYQALEEVRAYCERRANDPDDPQTNHANQIVIWLDEILDYIDEHQL